MKKVLLTMLGSIVLLSSADGMKRSPSLVGDALKGYMSSDVMKDDDGNDLDSKEAAVLRYKTREALDALKNSEESDKAAIERLSSENQEVKYDAELVKKAWDASGVTDEQGNAESLPDDMSAAVSRLTKLWGTDVGEDMLADSSEKLLGKREGTTEEVVKKMIVDPALMTREEIIQKAKDKALQAAKDAKEEASQAVRDAKEEASQAVRDAKEEAAKSLTNMKRYRGLVATLQGKIKELEAALEQAQNAPKAQEQEIDENVGGNTPSVELTNAPETKETAKVQGQPQKPVKAQEQPQKPAQEQTQKTTVRRLKH